MKDSRAFKEWQRDLDYLAIAYNISGRNIENEPADVFSQILKAALAIPEEVEQLFGQKTRDSMEQFLKTTAGSLLELQNLLKISLNLNLISISDYHSLTESMHEIGEITQKFITNFNNSVMDSDQKIMPGTGENAYWTLN